MFFSNHVDKRNRETERPVTSKTLETIELNDLKVTVLSSTDPVPARDRGAIKVDQITIKGGHRGG